MNWKKMVDCGPLWCVLGSLEFGSLYHIVAFFILSVYKDMSRKFIPVSKAYTLYSQRLCLDGRRGVVIDRNKMLYDLTAPLAHMNQPHTHHDKIIQKLNAIIF